VSPYVASPSPHGLETGAMTAGSGCNGVWFIELRHYIADMTLQPPACDPDAKRPPITQRSGRCDYADFAAV
jgi:hypothetical protein